MKGPRINADELRRRLSYNADTGIFTRNVSLNYRHPVGSVAGTEHKHGYIIIGIDGHYYKAHRLAWLYVHGEWPPSELDHINRVKKDNSIKNLEPKSRSANTLNCVDARVNNQIGVLGVSRRSSGFIARLGVDGVTRYLGHFKTPEEASAAYWAAKRQLPVYTPVA